MALKSLFLPQSCKNQAAAGGSGPSGTRLNSNGLFSTEPKLENFCSKNIYFWLMPPLSYHNPGCAAGRIRLCRHIFQAILQTACETS